MKQGLVVDDTVEKPTKRVKRVVKAASKFTPEEFKTAKPAKKEQKKANEKDEKEATKSIALVDKTGPKTKQRICAFSIDPEEQLNEKKVLSFVDFMYAGMERKHLRTSFRKYNQRNETLSQTMNLGVITTNRKTWFYTLFERTEWLSCEVIPCVLMTVFIFSVMAIILSP